MKSWYFMVFSMIVFLLMPWWGVEAWAGELKLGEAVACLDVIDRMPKGQAKEFPATVKRIFCYTVIEGGKEPAEVAHVWKYKNKRLLEIRLPVRSMKWRTWSQKNILSNQVGPWTVEIIDTSSNTIMGTVEFSVK